MTIEDTELERDSRLFDQFDRDDVLALSVIGVGELWYKKGHKHGFKEGIAQAQGLSWAILLVASAFAFFTGMTFHQFWF